MRVGRSLSALASIALAIASCGGENAASQLVRAPEFAPKSETKCSITKSRERPLIVEWPSSDRLELETKTRKGLVVVRYVGCEMAVLGRCSVPSKYNYLGGTRKEDRVEMKDADDLYANLPIGAARLEGKLQRSGRLIVNMNLVGRYEAERPNVRADELEGDCAGATHFVYGITVGAFDFYAGGEANIGGSASVGSVGVGGHSEAQRETLAKDGDVVACEKAAPGDKEPPAQCGALIRIEVVALGDQKKRVAACPTGSQWDGEHCVRPTMVSQGECPGGSRWDGSKCIASVDTRCADGTHFETGAGCVADVATHRLTPASGSQATTASDAARELGVQSNAECRESAKVAGSYDFEDCTARCNAGGARACYRLGEMYRKGDGVQRDPERGVSLLRRSCSLGDSYGCTRLQALRNAHLVPGE
jgi:hypothetical protein